MGLGGSCWASRDCGTDLFCSPQGVCAPSGNGDVGDPCGTGAECKKTLVCQVFGFAGQCVAAGSTDLGGACTASTDCLGGLVCGGDGTCKSAVDAFPPFTGVDCAADEAPFRAFFEVPRAGTPPPDFFRLPFPNDARVSATGELDMSDFPRPGPSFLGFDLIALYVDALVADFTGFSSTGAVTFRFSEQFNFDSLNGGENLHYIDITPGAPELGADRARRFGYSSGRGLFVCQNQLVVRNESHQPLMPNHIYAVYLTTGIRSVNGDAPAIEPEFAVVMSDTAPTDSELLNAWNKYKPFRDYLSATAGISASDISVAAVFTVQDTTGRAERLAAAVAGEALPQLKDLTLCDGTTPSPCDDGGQRVCGATNADFYEIHGRFTVPIYQGGTPPYETTGGGIVETGGTPQKQADEDVCFALTIPKAATMPTGGWPVVVFTHGTGGSFKSPVNSGVSKSLATASQPTAVFSFDGVVHGERARGSTRDAESLMFNVINPPAARDNNLQGAVDVMQALRLGQAHGSSSPVTLPGAGATAFDATKVYYFGHSQGSNVGSIATAVTSEATGVILSGAGGFLTDGILGKTSPVNAKAGLEFIVGEQLSRTHPLMTIWQTYFDSSDPINFAPLLMKRPPSGVTGKNVYHSWGAGDTFSPKATLNAMSRATLLPNVSPIVESIGGATATRPLSDNITTPDGARTGGTFQYDPDGAYDGHFVATRDPKAIADWLAFLTSLSATGTATVP